MADRTVLAARLHAHGEPLAVEEVELPEPGPDEVRVAMAYSGVNPVDRYAAAGRVAPDGPLPRTLGSEGAGTVDGRPVVIHGHGVGTARDGLWATAAVVPAEATIDVPDGVALDVAAAVGVAGVTAWRTATELAGVGGADRVLVLGASGGVGSMLVSICRNLGAEVAGQTGDAGKAGWVRERGATSVLVGDAGEIAESASDLSPTVVFDALGGGFTGTAINALAPRGRLVIFGTSAGPEGTVPLQQLYRKGLRVFGYGGLIEPAEALRAGTVAALQALAEGRFEVVVGDRAPLAEVNEALDRQAGRKVLGKQILELERR